MTGRKECALGVDYWPRVENPIDANIRHNSDSGVWASKEGTHLRAGKDMTVVYRNVQWDEKTHVLSFDCEVTGFCNTAHLHQEYHLRLVADILTKSKQVP